MTTIFSTAQLQKVFTFPFQDERRKGKLVIGLGLMLAGFIIPILPAFFLYGYVYQIMHRVIVEKGDLYLPEWEDWGKLLKDGWRLFCVYFLYNLPALLLYLIGMIFYFGSFIGFSIAAESNPEGPFPLLLMGSMGLLLIFMGLAMVITIVVSLILPAAIGHTVAKGKFSAGFDFTGWWKVLRSNLGGFIISILLIYGLGMVLMVISQLLYMTIVLCCLMYVVWIVGGLYLMLVMGALTSLVYREGLEKLDAVEAG